MFMVTWWYTLAASTSLVPSDENSSCTKASSENDLPAENNSCTTSSSAVVHVDQTQKHINKFRVNLFILYQIELGKEGHYNEG